MLYKQLPPLGAIYTGLFPKMAINLRKAGQCLRIKQILEWLYDLMGKHDLNGNR